MKTLMTLLMVFGISSAMAGEMSPRKKKIVYGTDLTMNENTLIGVIEYFPDAKVYKIVAVNFIGEGFSYVSAEGLMIARPSLDYQKLKENPKHIVGTEFTIDKELPTFYKSEVRKRRAYLAGR